MRLTGRERVTRYLMYISRRQWLSSFVHSLELTDRPRNIGGGEEFDRQRSITEIATRCSIEDLESDIIFSPSGTFCLILSIAPNLQDLSITISEALEESTLTAFLERISPSIDESQGSPILARYLQKLKSLRMDLDSTASTIHEQCNMPKMLSILHAFSELPQLQKF